MKLINAHVSNFRSVENSEDFSLDDITCLVGKNESGKTAILQALAGLNPHPATPITYDKERDYPRRFLTQYDIRHSDEDAVVVSTRWKISEEEKQAIREVFGADAVTDSEVIIRRRYEEKHADWTIPINLKAAVQHIVAQAKFSAPEKSQVQSAENTETLRAALEAIPSPTEKQRALLEKINGYPDRSITGRVKKLLEDSFPRFMYFSNYDRMSGEVQLQILQKRVSNRSLFTDVNLRGDRLFYEFLDYAGVPLDDLLAAGTYEAFNARLQGASNDITDQILDYWSQNPDISVNVTVNSALPDDPPPFNEGTIARARIYNGLHRVDVPFSERSAGFIWFFSFLIKFAQVRKDDGPIILLLDEPGLTLHGKAQADLLRYFREQLAPHHQIIYSTHSPFMVPPDELTSARIVEDLVDENAGGRRVPIGTKVREDVLNSDPDTIFPLQGALGYEITQTLFVGKHTLLVEGPSDILYLKALSAALAKRGREPLDGKWTLCPSGGIGNIRPFVSLFKGNSLNVVVLTDIAKGEKRKVELLKESQVLKAGAVLTLDQFTGKVEADIEDVFEPQLFVDLLNEAYQLEGAHELSTDKLEAADTTTSRLVKKAKAYFRTLPATVAEFDHYYPSEWLLENPNFLKPKKPHIEATLDRAENIIKAVNQLLSN